MGRVNKPAADRFPGLDAIFARRSGGLRTRWFRNALGAVLAACGAEGKPPVIGDAHGRPLPLGAGVTLFPLYHPASIIYRRELKPVYEQDVRALKAYLETVN